MNSFLTSSGVQLECQNSFTSTDDLELQRGRANLANFYHACSPVLEAGKIAIGVQEAIISHRTYRQELISRELAYKYGLLSPNQQRRRRLDHTMHTLRAFVLTVLLVGAYGHPHHDHDQPADPLQLQSVFVQDPLLSRQQPFTGPTWTEKYGSQIDSTFSGPLSFSHLPYSRCLDSADTNFDIAVLGLPFDTATSYRPGARFGPYAIRSGSRRQRDSRGYTLSWAIDPFAQGQTIIDCGDVPVTPFDNALAIDQIEVAYSTLLARSAARDAEVQPVTSLIARDGLEHPRIISLGGDHTIVLPILRSLNKVYGPISVIHFDAHLDTWPAYPGQATEQSRVTHGTFFYLAQEEGLLGNNSIHGGIRCKLAGTNDLDNDSAVGFQVISTDDIDDLGIPTIIKKIRERIGDSPVYLSLDIDVIDPGLAPATGTPEAGGWTTRELKRIIRGLAGLNFVGADIVEVAPAYDNAEITGIAAADFVHDFLSMLMVKAPPAKPGHH